MKYSIEYMNLILCIQGSLEGLWSCFYLLVFFFLNTVAMNIGVQISFQVLAFNSWGIFLKVELLDDLVKLPLKFRIIFTIFAIVVLIQTKSHRKMGGDKNAG